ncbi:MAG: membrane dipeptidase [Clostridia bacterium]|nr:membrane dipeptidase [Clostridia bacterium]
MYEKKQIFAENNLHIDRKRMEKYGGYTQVFAIFMPPDNRNAREYTKALTALFYKEMQENGITVCQNYSDITASKTRYNALLSIEGAECVEKVSDISALKKMGVFMIAPTWNFRNKLACGAMEERDTGLSGLGKSVISEMDRLGIILDVSHMSERSFFEAAKIFGRPICASHSNLKSVVNHRRNLTDEQFSVIKESGGVACINLYPDFLGKSVKEHIDRFLALGGEDNIGLGCDFDGVDRLPEGISGIESIEGLIKNLPYSTKIRRKIAEDNFLRVLKCYNC